MLRLTADQRRLRVGWRHRLAAPARTDDVAEVARSLVVLHATDPATVYLSVTARLVTPGLAAVERALYEERSVHRMLAMRRTLFGVASRDVAMVHAAAGAAVAADERRKLHRLLIDAEPRTDPRAVLDPLESQVLALLAEEGELATAEVVPRVAGLDRRVAVGVGTRHETTVSLGSRLLQVMAAEGRLARARPRGTWLSSQHRWAVAESWFGQPLERIDPAVARVELARRWLERFGPATVADLKWWTGWTLGATRAALASLDLEPVDLDGVEGIVLADDVEPCGPAPTWVALLPGLDPTTMGWKQRDWYLGDHASALFDTAGNAGATVWVDGRVVGGWAQREDGTVVHRLLDDVGEEAGAAIEGEVARLEQLIGRSRVTPRFGSPLHRELLG